MRKRVAWLGCSPTKGPRRWDKHPWCSGNQALESRKVIGQALGLISERYGVDENRAFGVLTRFSQTSNTKLRVVAADIVATANRSAAGGPVVNGSDPGAVVFNTGA